MIRKVVKLYPFDVLLSDGAPGGKQEYSHKRKGPGPASRAARNRRAQHARDTVRSTRDVIHRHIRAPSIGVLLDSSVY